MNNPLENINIKLVTNFYLKSELGISSRLRKHIANHMLMTNSEDTNILTHSIRIDIDVRYQLDDPINSVYINSLK